MSGYTVNYRELLSNASKILDEADRYAQTAEKFKSSFEELASSWEGPASRRFKDEQEQCYVWYKSMAEVARDFGTRAAQAAVKYIEAEEKARAAILNR